MADHVRVNAAARIRVVFGGEVIADTDRGFVVHEGGMPARYYVPRDAVRAQLTDTDDTGACPWKGKWRHLDVTVGAKRIPRAAWTYDSVTEVARPIEGFISFYPNKVDSIDATEAEG